MRGHCWIRHIRGGIVVTAAASIGVHARDLTAQPAETSIARPAVDAIIAAFAQHPVVALGMSHRLQDQADFSLALLRDLRFSSTVNDIVIECGNPLYQRELDDYVSGKDVPIEKLQLSWRNTTQPGSCDPRQHKELLDAVREVNRHQPRVRRIRVLAGDPAIDWDRINRPEDIAPFMTQRDTHFASVVLDQVLSHHRKALLVIGAGHVLRHPITWASVKAEPDPTVTMLIEDRVPGAVYVIIPHDGFGDRNGELEPRLASLPIPSLVPVRDSWIGLLEAGTLFRGKIRRVGTDPSSQETPFPGLTVQDIADAYLYLGTAASLHEVVFPRETGTAYAKELDRRRRLEGGGPLPIVPVKPADSHVELISVPGRTLLMSSHKPMVSSNTKIGPP